METLEQQQYSSLISDIDTRLVKLIDSIHYNHLPLDLALSEDLEDIDVSKVFSILSDILFTVSTLNNFLGLLTHYRYMTDNLDIKHLENLKNCLTLQKNK